MGRLIILLLSVFFVTTGCMEASRIFLSSDLHSLNQIKPAYQSSQLVSLSWKARSSNNPPESYTLEYKKKSDAQWSVIVSGLAASNYAWDISGLLDDEYEVRVIALVRQSQEILYLGHFIVDNVAPQSGGDQTVSVIEDIPKAFSLLTPIETDKYVIKIVSAPTKGVLTGCVHDSAILDCLYTPSLDNDVDDSFSYRFVDRAGNQSTLTTVTIAMTPVNDAPVITTLLCPVIAEKHINYNCLITATDVDLPSPLSLSFHATASHTCSWATIDSYTGVISGLPQIADVGQTCKMSVIARDDQALDSIPFSWDVEIKTGLPSIQVSNLVPSILEDSAMTVILSDSEVSSLDEGNAGVYSLALSGGAGDKCQEKSKDGNSLLINPLNGEVQFMPAPDYQGECKFIIQIEDFFGQIGSTEVTLTVTNIDDVPVIPAQLGCLSEAFKRTAYSCVIDIYDPDPETLTTTMAPTCAWMSVSVSDRGRKVTITGTPLNGDVGTDCSLSLTTNDGTTSVSDSLTVEVKNAPPSLVVGTPLVLTEDDPSFATALVEVLTDAQVSSNDEGQGGVYSLEFTSLSGTACNDITVLAVPTDLVIHPTNGSVKIKPRANYYGQCYFNIQFDDKNELSDSVVKQQVMLTVNAVNDRPSIVSAPLTHEILLNPSGDTPSSFDIGISVGPPNESDQVASLICSSNNPRLVAQCSATRAGDGTISVGMKALPGLDTSAILTIQVKDDGGGDDISSAVTVSVSIVDAVVLTPISSNVQNYDVYNAAVAQFGATVANSSRTFVVTVTDTGIVTSNIPELPAMMTGTLSALARVRIVNDGVIAGAHGLGGFNGSTIGEGAHGGTALRIDRIHAAVNIYNNGLILGGGGGGGRGGTNSSGSGIGGNGQGYQLNATNGASSDGAGGFAATEFAGGLLGDTPTTGIWSLVEQDGNFGSGGNGCHLGLAYGNNAGSGTQGYAFGRGGIGAGWGGAAGLCSLIYGGGGGGGHYGGGGGAGGLSRASGSDTNYDINGFGGGNGGAAIEVSLDVVQPQDAHISIYPGQDSKIAGAVWNDYSGYYLINVTNDSDPKTRVLTFIPKGANTVNNPSSIKVWNNGRGNVYR